jgi:hypothetical protein
MPISIVGDGSITGLTAGGLPDASVVDLDLATGISSSKLTGALPALDGSSLTGVGVTGITSSANSTAITISSGEDVTLTNALTIQNARSTSSGDGSLIFDPSDSTVSYSIRQQTGDELVFETYASSAWSDILRFTSDGRGLSQFTAKAWCKWSASGSSSNLTYGHNVSSVSYVTTGHWRVNYTNNLTTNYSAQLTCEDNGGRHTTFRAGEFTTSYLGVFISNVSQAGTTSGIVCATMFGE